MGIAVLEEQYQHIKESLPGISDFLCYYANLAQTIQQQMRITLNRLTPAICGDCEHKCCEGFPLEGWFSIEDYLLFRISYGKPRIPDNRIEHAMACSFLTSNGCSLPDDLRPFTCVKINCKKISESLRSRGMEKTFNQLKNGLDIIHRHLALSINEAKLPTVP